MSTKNISHTVALLHLEYKISFCLEIFIIRGYKMFVIRNVTCHDVLSQAFRATRRRESHGVILFTLFSVALSAVETISLEKRSTMKKKRRNADRLSRASRAVDLHVAGSDKSATAETAVTSREIDGEREGTG